MSARRPRALLAALGALAAAVGLAVPASPEPPRPPAARCERVVLVVLGGGVRSQEMLRRPDLVPTLAAIRAAGFGSDGWTAGGADPTDATKAILCGRTVPVATPGRVRPAWPTLLECVRKDRALGPDAAWFASFADGEALDLGSSDHPDFGPSFWPRLAYGEGPFGEPLRGLFRLFGRPNPTTERTWAHLATLRAVTAKASSARGIGAGPAALPEALRLERALLEEVDRRAADLGGAAPLDARAVRAGITVLRVFRPTLLVIRLGQADAGRASVAAYEEVLRRNDAEIGRLRATIAADPVLARSTALVVTADLGRDARPNAEGGYGRTDGSPEQTTVAVVGEGPGLARGATPRGPHATKDLAPTLARLLGAAMPAAVGDPAAGVVREELLSR